MSKIHFDDLGATDISACGLLAGGGALLVTNEALVDCLSCLRCIEGARNGGGGITCQTLRPTGRTS